MKVLVTGGMGYIGSHTCVQMLEVGIEPVILDNLCNIKTAELDRLEALTQTRPVFYQGDIRDETLLNKIFSRHDIKSVIHFAGLKAVGEEWLDRNMMCAAVRLFGGRAWRT